MIGADFTVRLVEVSPEDPGAEARPQHVHDRTGEFVWVLEGRGTVHAAGQPFEIAAGEGVYVPPGEHHKIAPLGGRPMKLLCFFGIGDITSTTRE
ncbi:MAG: cupin domain-containing protein [Acidimicrobiales bacterium]